MLVNSVRPLHISLSTRDDCITLQPAVINFGKVKIGERATLRITLINNSSYELKLTPQSFNTQFYLPHRIIRLNGHQTRTLDVIYRPTTEQASNAQIQLNSESVCQGIISVSGLGVR